MIAGVRSRGEGRASYQYHGHNNLALVHRRKLKPQPLSANSLLFVSRGVGDCGLAGGGEPFPLPQSDGAWENTKEKEEKACAITSPHDEAEGGETAIYLSLWPHDSPVGEML